MKKWLQLTIVTLLFCLINPAHVEAITNVVQTDIADNSATITWNGGVNDSYYSVYIWIPESKWDGNKLITNYKTVYLGDTQDTKFVFNDLEPGIKYEFFIGAFDEDDEDVGYYQGSIKTLPGEIGKMDSKLKWASYYSETVGNASTYKMKYNLYVDIEAQDCASGYEICLSNAKGKKVKTVKVDAYKTSIVRHTFYNLKESVYQVSARAYTDFNNKRYYGPWSEKQYVLRQPKALAKFSGGKMYIKWESLNGATAYDVYVCDSKFGDYTKCKSVKKNTKMVSIKKVKGKKFKKGKKYYFYVVAKKKSGNKTYESVLSQRFSWVYK